MDFFWILFPIFSIFVVGFIAQKILRFDIQNLSKMSLYVLSPFLAFRTFYTHELTFDYVYLAFYVFALCLGLVLIISLWSKLMKYSESVRCGMILSACFMNNGNYGVPVILMFFGAQGFDLAIILLVLQQVVMSTIGIYYAAKGSDRQSEASSMKYALIRVIKMPVAYGALLGIIFQLIHIPMSDSVMKSISMIGDSSIVVIMIILGMQLAMIQIKEIDLPKLSISLIVKMVISPILAYGLVMFLPLPETYKTILIILAAMPAAANTTLQAVFFNTQPKLVSSSTFISTILSLITLPIIMWLLNVSIPT